MEISSLHRSVQAADLPLERLATNSSIPESDRIHEVGRQFEAMLLRQILTQAQKPAFPSRMTPESTSTSVYRDLMTNQLADEISRSGSLGLTQEWQVQMQQELGKRPLATQKHSAEL